jgi:hypothetical protein
MTMKPARVEILVDELVLHGFSPAERYAIAESLARELQQLVAAGNPGELAGLGNSSVLRANNVTLSAGTKSPAVGAQVAGAVHGSLTASMRGGGQ